MRRAVCAGLLLLVAVAPLSGRADEDTSAVASARVAVAPERVWSLLTDFDTHGGFAPSALSSAVEWIEPARLLLRQTVRVGGFRVRYTLATTLDRERGTVEGVLDPNEPHDVADIATSWRVGPHPEGGTRVELRVRMRSGLPLPRWLEQRATERTTRETLLALVRAARDPEPGEGTRLASN
jgi:ribosome-associated toxin RatA of RatAB toxin-antitoxin module